MSDSADGRDYYLSLFDALPTLIWRAGTDAKCDYFNQAWLDFTGRRLEQELGDGWAEGVHPEDHDRFFEMYLGAFHERRAFEMEYRLRYHTGEWRWIVEFGSPFLLPDRDFGGYIGCCYDLTEHKRAEDYERRLHEALEHQQQALELNDNILQGLVVAKMALEMDEGHMAEEAIGETLGKAREIIGRLIRDAEARGMIRPGSFVRERPALLLREDGDRD